MGNILVFLEHNGTVLKKSTLSCITFAKIIAEKTKGALTGFVAGKNVSAAAQDALKYGFSKIYVVDDVSFEHYLAQPFAFAVKEVAVQAGCDYVCGTATTMGKDLLPRVAGALNAGMVSEVLEVLGDSAPFHYKRELWAGNVSGEIEITTPKAVFSVRGTAFAPAAASGVSGETVAFKSAYDFANAKMKFVEFKPSVSTRPELTEAAVVVAGGRGLRDKDGFKIVEPLADLFNAAIGGTRAVVDAGILGNDFQIGQTGKVIAPGLYFGVALSGAIQHVAGMKASKVVVAVNKDEEAPIFAVADYGLVADAFKAVPELVEEIKKAK
jgi:electron transfer flavoprotein alpha subunit